MIKKIIFFITAAIILFGAYCYIITAPTIKESAMQYGVTFGITRATDLGLNWKDVYLAVLNDLQVKRFRLIAEWPLIEAKQGVYDFTDTDYLMNEAQSHGAKVILAVGRRVPGYPECHDPTWLAQYSSDQEQQVLLLQEVTAVVNRYKNSPALQMWQVENEPYFDSFTRIRGLCPPLNTQDIANEIALVRKLDPNHQIIVTDGGELGTWYQAYRAADVFGTSTYLYVWNSFFGYIRYPIGPWYFRIKTGLMRVLFGTKPTTVIELQSEPWMPGQSLSTVPVATQLTHFDMDRMNELIEYPYESGFTSAYLWGDEWWYWMKMNGHPEFWNRAKTLFQ